VQLWKNVRLTAKERRKIMSMDSDSRLIMMALRDKGHRLERTSTRKSNGRRYNAAAASSLAAFALTLFIRTA